MSAPKEFIPYLLMKIEGAILKHKNSTRLQNPHKQPEVETAEIQLPTSTSLQSILLHAESYFGSKGSRSNVEKLGNDRSIKIVNGKYNHLVQASINKEQVLLVEITSSKAF